jgi:hypothetical protein
MENLNGNLCEAQQVKINSKFFKTFTVVFIFLDFCITTVCSSPSMLSINVTQIKL